MSQEKNSFFSDEEYYENLEVPPANKKSSKEEEKSPIEKTFDTANDCRKFETEFFWQRGTYYWAFILASFTAHFACMGNFFDGKPISFCDIKDLPDFSLLALAVTAFFCFFFSYAWVIVNKGSKFWQENWEKHIGYLEEKTVGHLFNVVMNENNTEECSPNIFSCKSYRYSVARMTQLTALVLMVASFLLFCFYIVILCEKFLPLLWIAVVGIILILIYLSHFLYSKPPRKGRGKKTASWYKTF
ncbi:MAG: hypothetical protein J6X67_09085 [Treponema sp.]|nr:hypothetical protein [Treponema sp.]